MQDIYDGGTARDAFAITPSDTVALEETTRGIYVGGDGDVTVVMAGNGQTVTFSSVTAGTILPIRATFVNDTLTTATNLVGLV